MTAGVGQTFRAERGAVAIANITSSLSLQSYLPGTVTACSWQAGWRSLLLRAYQNPARVDEFSAPATADHLIVLVTAGSFDFARRTSGRWLHAHREPGNIGMIAPGQEVAFRWHGDAPHNVVQLHLPAAIINGVLDRLSTKDQARLKLPDTLATSDPLIESVILGLTDAIHDGAPDLYGEEAAHFLAAHVVLRGTPDGARPPLAVSDARLHRAEAFIRENLATSLAAIADEAGLSRFHIIRLYKRSFGETIFEHITRLRIEKAQHLLTRRRESVTEVAARCGYENPAHFATAFRRLVGVPPSTYRSRSRS